MTTALCFELDHTVSYCVERIIAGYSDVRAWMKAGSPLSDENIAGSDQLAAVSLHTKALGLTIAPVSCRTCPFFMCHDKSPLLCVLINFVRSDYSAFFSAAGFAAVLALASFFGSALAFASLGSALAFGLDCSSALASSLSFNLIDSIRMRV